MNDRRKLQALPWSDRWWLIQALGWLGLMRVAVWLMPFQRIVARLRLTPGECVTEMGAIQIQTAKRISWAIGAVASRTPWPSTCLVQALAGLVMLKRRGILGTLYLGVAKNASDTAKTDTHAWLRCGSTILTGAAGHERFNVIATYTAH